MIIKMTATKLFKLPMILAALISLSGFASASGITKQKSSLRVLMVGGGPDQKHNQVAIESNIRYVYRLLPAGAPVRVLFTDGNLQSENVQCQGDDKKIFYRTPQLPRLDGPSKSGAVRTELDGVVSDLRARSSSRALLYFTGHGSPNPASQFNNNHYDLWDKDRFTVQDLAGAIKTFPKNTPIVLVMVQCYSGAFGNVLFEDGDPTLGLIDQHICGFFASVPQRPAAGCTPEINEAEYKDFTSYFFAALTGTDRVGRTVTGADYNHDGKVVMSEAFDYALFHDDSIDTPVCTSDTFLRKFVKTTDDEIFKTPYSKARSWATPGQLAALEGLSKLLDLSGDDQLTTAHDLFVNTKVDSMEIHDVRLIRFVRLAKSIILAHTLNASGDRSTKARFADLVKAEAGNPLKD
jgi:hypothetical protein